MSIYERIGSAGLDASSIRGILAGCRGKVERVVKAALGRMMQACEGARQAKADIPAVPVPDETFGKRLEVEVAAQVAHIRGLQEKLARALQANKAFRGRHGLLGEQEAPNVVLSILVLGLMVFLEAALNVTFFLNAHMVADPLAGLLVCLVISSTNILACASAGFFIGRWLDYGRNAIDPNAPEFAHPRRHAIVLKIVFMAVMALFHITVGLIRAQESLESVTHSLSAYLTILTTPEALFLVITGVCLSCIAFAKGRTSVAGAYPYAHSFQRAVQDAQTAVDDALADTTDDIEDLSDEAIKSLEQAQSAYENAIKTYNQHVDEALVTYQELVQTVANAESQLDTEIAHIEDSYHSAGGRMEADFDRTAFCSFQACLAVALPEHLAIPEQTQLTTPIHTAKAEALARMAALCANQTTSTQEE